jgi:hypothetical protein
MPAGGMQGIHGFEELLRHAMDKHSGPAVAGVKRKRDGNMDSECTAPAPKRKRDGDTDSECTAPAAKRKRDGDMDIDCTAPAAKRKEGGDAGECTAPAAKRTAPASKRKEGGGDGDYTAPAAKHKEGGDNGEYTAPAAVRKRAAKHNVAYKEPSPFVIYDPDSDPCEDVIICASTADEQHTCYLEGDHRGPSAILDSDFLAHVDPALLAL